MEACEVVRLLVNKAIVPVEPKRRGTPGYGRIKALRVLVFARLKRLDNDTRVVEHLKKHPWIAKTLGLDAVPDRTTVGRWWRRYLNILEETFLNIADMLQLIEPTKAVIVDSTPLVDLYDMEARWVIQAEENSEALNFIQQSTSLDYPSGHWLHQAIVTTGRFFQS
jgi:hypothetical protein